MNILITGVSKGLGLTITETILKRGWTVYGISRNKTLALQALLDLYPDHFYWLSYDLSDAVNVKKQIFKDWIGYQTPVHGFVNNAALAYDDIITNLNIVSLENMYKVNVFTPMNICKYVIQCRLVKQTL